MGCRYLRLPVMLGYLLAGLLIGPNALALIEDAATEEHLAEFGVVFLMFVIGLEFNLPKLIKMKGLVFGFGLGQVGLTITGTVVVNFLVAMAFEMMHGYWKIKWETALVLGSALAMSSTAILGKLMSERLELESPHGQRVMGILLFQDLAVVPLMVLVPALADLENNNLFQVLAIALIKATFLVGSLLWGGQKLVHRWLHLIARRRSDELFMLNILLMTLGLSWLTELAGLSLAMGAFIAGMLIAETEFKHKVEEDIRPFHDLLLGLFFITIGMKLNFSIVFDNLALVIGLSVIPVVVKAGVVYALSRIQGTSPGVSLRTGLFLAQAGEFGFVLLSLGGGHRLVPSDWISPILAAMVLSMMATPFIIMNAEFIVNKLIKNDWFNQSCDLVNMAKRITDCDQHVIVCGYGRSGRVLVELLHSQNLSYVALDADPEKVHMGIESGHRVEFADAAKLACLKAAGLKRAKVVVITYPDVLSAMKVLAWAKEYSPKVPVIVRVQDDKDLEKLMEAGAKEVVPEIFEGTLMLASQTLVAVGMPVRKILRIVQLQRAARDKAVREKIINNHSSN